MSRRYAAGSGEGLRQAMEQAGLTGQQAAYLLGCSPSRVSRLLSGKRGGSEVDVASFLGVCRFKGPERDQLLALCRPQHTPGWLQQHGSRLPKQLRTLIDHENKAAAISVFESTLVTGMLQTGDYARAMISHNVNIPADEVDDRVAARLARHSLFSHERPPRFTFYLHETVLRLPIGDPAVMSTNCITCCGCHSAPTSRCGWSRPRSGHTPGCPALSP